MNHPNSLPTFIDSETSLMEVISRPSLQAVETMSRIDGDVIILGAGGKIGSSLARLAKRATVMANVERQITAVSRFSDPALKKSIEDFGVKVLDCDLLNRKAVETLPVAANVIYLAGMKFGASHDQPLTWASNVYM